MALATRPHFTPHDWYWHITGGTHRPDVPGEPVKEHVYSSAKGKYVSFFDADYVAWTKGPYGDQTTAIDTEEHLKSVLEIRHLEFGKPAVTTNEAPPDATIMTASVKLTA